MENYSLTWVFCIRFSVPRASISMLGSLGGTRCNGVCSLVHSCWNSRDISMAGMCNCVKDCVSFMM